MTTDIWAARTVRFNRIAAKLRGPDWARRVALVSARLTKPDCFRCGGADFMHSVTCARRPTYLNTRVALGNAVIKAAAKHEAWIERRCVEIMAQLKASMREHGVAL